MARPLAALPKAHLHLHFTGSMPHTTLVELAAAHRIHLPDALVSEWPPRLSAADERGWFRFQRLYDTARSVVRTEADVRRLLSEAARASASTGVGIGVIVAANRTKHPLEARTLARLASQFAGQGVTGFGLSNDERRGGVAAAAPPFRIARRAGLCSVPHGGELVGPASVVACLDDL